MSKISVLIPTYNAAGYLSELIPGLLNQKRSSNDELEIIVVDSSSTDRTQDILSRDYPEVTVHTIENKQFDHGGTRNLLANLATGDFLLFMTQDAIPYNDELIVNLKSEFADENVLVCYARQIPKRDASPLEVFARSFNYPDRRVVKDQAAIKELGIKTFFNSNVCSMYRSSDFHKNGGFPEKIILNEDMIYASKVVFVGKKVVYVAEARVYHSHNYSLKQQFKRYFDIGMAFDETKYLLEHASNEKEGMRMVKKQLKYLIEMKKPYLIPYAILEAASKFIGYNLGKRHQKMPHKWKRRYSAYMKG